MRPAQRPIIALAGLALVWLGIRIFAPTAARQNEANCTRRLRAAMPLQLRRYDVTVPVTVNGHETRFALDTGTSDSYVLEQGRNAFSLPAASMPDSWTVGSFAGDKVQTDFVKVASLGFAGRDYADRVMPVTRLETAPGDARAETGTIGADLLKDVDVDLDIPNLRIAFYAADPACADREPPWTARSVRVKIAPLGGGSPTIPVAYDGVTTPTLFASYWERTLVRDYPVGTVRNPQLVPETPAVPLAPLAVIKTIAIGSVVDGPVIVRLWRKPPPVDYVTHPDTSNVAILGFDVIRRHRFWLSLASRQLFVALPD